MRPDRIPGYRLERLLGRGGMASVYLAIQESLQRPVALKILTESDSAEFSERFINEGRMIASLAHTHIVTVHDVGISDGLHFLAMEYVEGGDLTRRIHTGVTPEFALELIEKIAGCLDLAHKRGIIHRDIKPANILFRSNAIPLLTDFGIAKHQRLDSDLTVAGTVLGSPHYISPEQAQGLPVDGRTDIYSLGIILYEMLTGKKPFHGNSVVDTIIKQIQEPIPTLPPEHACYQRLLNRMIGKTPEERFATAGELLESVKPLCDSVSPASLGTTATLRLYASPPAVLESERTARIEVSPPAPPIKKHWARYALSAVLPLALACLFAYKPEMPPEAVAAVQPIPSPARPATAALDSLAVPLPSPIPAQPPAAADAPSPASRAVEAKPVDLEAVFAQAKAYRDGTGVLANDNKAFELFRQAAAQGHAAAQYYLGLMYGQGRGVTADDAQAAYWFEQAARRNVVDAQYFVCLSYALGRGVARDPIKAYAWCDIASHRGSDKAPEALAKLSNIMGPPKRRLAHDMALRLTREIQETTLIMVGSAAAANVK